jgi:hypothetical protein
MNDRRAVGKKGCRGWRTEVKKNKPDLALLV